MKDLRGRRLLIVSGDSSDITFVKAAKEMGIYTVCCDSHTDWKKSPAKFLADEAWNIDYSDTELVAQKCRECHINGVIAGYGEERVLAASRISHAIGTHFYATEKQIGFTRNKREFKRACICHGVKTPEEFCNQIPMTEEEIERIKYPVIVKPSDNGGRKGITICNSPGQLDDAVKFARENSKTGEIVVEEYLDGIELSAIYTISAGKISLSCLNDKYVSENEGGKTKLCDLVVTPSIFYERFLKECDPGLKALLKDIGAENGVANIQLIANDKGITAFEMGYRVNGNDDFKTISRYNGIDFMKMLISYSLCGEMGDNLGNDDPCFKEFFCTSVVHLKSGVVGKVDFNRLLSRKNIVEISIWKEPGDHILETGTNFHKAGMIKFTSESYDEIVDTIHYIDNNLIILDEKGNDMRMFHFNTERLCRM